MMQITRLFAHGYSRHAGIALSFLIAVLVPACETTDLGHSDTEVTPAAAPAAPNEKQAAQIRALEETNATLQLKLLERNADLIRMNEERNEAVQEVVRTKSKLRGIESPAEAASTMAEVEIAMKQVKSAVAQTQQDLGPGIREAEQLLATGAKEFEKGNYGGAIYLATQAKSLIGTRREQIGAHNTALQPDEEPFAFPIALRTLTKSNVRSGPGLSFSVLRTLPTDTALLGLSYKNEWVRIRLDDDRDGWMHYKLVDNQHSSRL